MNHRSIASRSRTTGSAWLLALLAMLPWQAALQAQPDDPDERRAVDADFQQKADRLQQAIQRRPRLGPTFDLWRQHYAAAGRLESWRRQIDNVVSDAPENANAQLLLGLAAESDKEWQRAEAAYRRAVEIDPTNYYSHWRLAECLLRQTRIDEAEQPLEAARSQSRVPRNDLLPITKRLASLYEQVGQRDQALKLWRELGDQFARDPRVLREVAARLQRLGGDAEALQLWQTLARTARDAQQRFDAELRAALLKLKLGQPEALDQLVTLLDRLEPGSWKARELDELIEQTITDQEGVRGLLEFWERRQTLRPSDLNANIKLAQTLAKAGEVARSIKHFEATWERAPHESRLIRGFVATLIQAGEIDRAIEVLAEFLAQNDHDDLSFQLAELQFRSNRTDAAIETWNDLASRSTGSALHVADAAQRCLAQQDWQRLQSQPQATIAGERLREYPKLVVAIERYYRRAIQDSSDVQLQQTLALWFHRTGRRQEALQLWQQAVRPNDVNAQLDLADRLVRHGYHAEAVSAAGRAIEIDPSAVAAWERRIDLELRVGQHEQATKTAHAMREQFADQPTIVRQAIRLEVAAIVAADSVDETLDEIDTTDFDRQEGLRWKFALLCEANQEYDRALQTLRQELQQAKPPTVDLKRYAVNLAMRLERDAVAVQWLSELCDDPERTAEDYQRLVQLHRKLDQPTQALQVAAAWSEWSPGSSEPHLMIAAIADEQNDATEQIDALHQAIRHSPDDVAILRQLATALFTNDRDDEAFEFALKAIQAAEPAYKPSLIDWILQDTPLNDVQRSDRNDRIAQLKQTLMQQRVQSTQERLSYSRSLSRLASADGHPGEALRHLEHALNEDPTNLDLLSELVELALDHDQLEAAIQFQRQRVALDERFEQTSRLARMLRMNGQNEEARAIWDELLNQRVDSGAATRWIQEYAADGRLYNGQQLIEAALSQMPDDPVLLYLASLAHLALEQDAEARATWRQLLLYDALANDQEPREPIDYLKRLELAAIANATYRELEARRNAWGATNRRTQEGLFRFTGRRQKVGEPSRSNVQVFAVSAWLNTMPDAHQQIANLLQDPALPSASREAILLAAWANGARIVLDASVAAPLGHTQGDSIDPVMRDVVLTLTPPQIGATPSIRDQTLSQVTQAFDSLRQSDPDLSQLLEDAYFGVLARCLQSAEWQGVVRREIERAERITTLHHVSQLLRVVDSVTGNEKATQTLRAALFERLNELEPADVEPPPTQTELVDLMLAAETWFLASETSSTSERQRSLQAVLPLIPLLVKVQEPEPEGNQNASEVLNEVRRGFASRLEQVDLNQQMVADLFGRTWQQRQVVDAELWLLPSREPSMIFDSDRFPHPTATLTDAKLTMLRRLSSSWDQRFERQQMIDRVSSRRSGANDEATLQARWALMWWGGQGDLIEPELQRQLKQQPNADVWKLTAARYFLTCNKIAEARKVVRPWTSDFVASRPAAQDILRTLEQRLREQFLAWKTLAGHRGAVTSLVPYASGEQLISTGIDGRILIWNISSGDPMRELDAHTDIVLTAAVSPDERQMVSGGYDRVVRVWDTSSWNQSTTLEFGTTIRVLLFLDNDRLLIGGDGGRLEVWSLKTKARLESCVGHAQDIVAVTLLRNTNSTPTHVVTTGTDRKICVWRMGPAELIQTVVSDGGVIRAVQVMGTMLVATGEDQRLTVRPITIDVEKPLADGSSISLGSTVRSLIPFPNSEFLNGNDEPTNKNENTVRRTIVGRDDGVLQVWNLETHQLELSFAAHEARILALATHPANNWVASAGFGGQIKLWRFDSIPLGSRTAQDTND